MSHDIVDTGLIAGTWQIDPAHSEVGFSVRHLMSKVRGTFQSFTGTVTTGTSLVESAVQASIEVSSVNTNNAQRDGHLRSADFFDPEAGQQLVFASTGIREGDDGYVIAGDLTINGVTRPVELATEFLGVAVDAYGLTRIGAEATVAISRKDYKVDFNVPLEGDKLLIGDKVDITLTIEAVLDQA